MSLKYATLYSVHNTANTRSASSSFFHASIQTLVQNNPATETLLQLPGYILVYSAIADSPRLAQSSSVYFPPSFPLIVREREGGAASLHQCLLFYIDKAEIL